VSRRRLVLAAVALGALSLVGCSKDGGTAAPGEATAEAATGTPGSEQASTLPEICPLLSKEEVGTLTGEQVTLMTDDGGASGSRYCQWQLSQGQVTVAANAETRESFDVRNQQATAVPGIGATAYFLSGHLYVWEDGRNVDVYVSSEGDDQANLDVAKRTAAQFLPRLAAAAKK
jgi:hypothetical protein